MDIDYTLIYGVIASILSAALMAAVVRRLLGAQVGWPRAIIVSAVALFAFTPVGLWVAQQTGLVRGESLTVGTGPVLALGLLAFCWALVACTAVLVLLEALVPTGSFTSPLQWPRAVRDGARRGARYLHISWIVISSGLSGALRQGPRSERFDEALVRMFERAGVSFVKLGQLLSTRQDVVPASTARALSRLQSAAEPAPSENILAALAKEWGQDPDAVLSRFDAEPLGAASIAQVHGARLADGLEVVLKVQRPQAQARVRVDGDIIVRFSRTAERRFGWAGELGLAALAGGLVKVMKEELDYVVEAGYTRTAARLLAGSPDLVVPQVYPELSSRRVLVMSRLTGVPVDIGAERLSQERRQQLATTLLQATLGGILVDGFFHADLHPGNLLLLDDGRLGLLDFGAVGVIDQETRTLLAALLAAIVDDDNVAAATALGMAFDLPAEVDRRLLRRELGRIMTLVHTSGEVGATLFTELFGLLRAHHIAVPGDVAGTFRTLASVEETLKVLDPTTSLLTGARSVMPSLMARLADPEQLARKLGAESLVALSVARRLPERTEVISDALARGEFSLRTHPLADVGERRWLRSVLDDAVSGFFAAVMAVLAVVLALTPGGGSITPELGMNQIAAAVLGLVSVVLALRVLVRVFARRSAHAD